MEKKILTRCAFVVAVVVVFAVFIRLTQRQMESVRIIIMKDLWVAI